MLLGCCALHRDGRRGGRGSVHGPRGVRPHRPRRDGPGRGGVRQHRHFPLAVSREFLSPTRSHPHRMTQSNQCPITRGLSLVCLHSDGIMPDPRLISAVASRSSPWSSTVSRPRSTQQCPTPSWPSFSHTPPQNELASESCDSARAKAAPCRWLCPPPVLETPRLTATTKPLRAGSNPPTGVDVPPGVLAVSRDR